MKIVKEYENPEGCQGCVYAGARLVAIALIIVLIWYVNSGCRTSEPCGTYSKWESKVKFRSN